MAKADYNIQKAVEALLSYQNKDDGGFGGVDETAMSIMALSNHMDIQGVGDAITKGVAYLKANKRIQAALNLGARKTLTPYRQQFKVLLPQEKIHYRRNGRKTAKQCSMPYSHTK